MKHPMERDSLRVRRRAAQCEIERTPRRERERERLWDESLELAMRQPIAELETELAVEAAATRLTPDELEANLRRQYVYEAALARTNRRIARRRWARGTLRFLLAAAALLLLVWLIIATEQAPNPCNARCEAQERSQATTTYEQLGPDGYE